MVVRIRADVDGAPDRHEWPIRIGIAIPFNAPTKSGLPSPDEDSALGYIEAMICSTAGDRAVLVIVITTSGMREFVLHARTHDWLSAFHEELRAAVPSRYVQMMADEHPSWSVYESFWN